MEAVTSYRLVRFTPVQVLTSQVITLTHSKREMCLFHSILEACSIFLPNDKSLD